MPNHLSLLLICLLGLACYIKPGNAQAAGPSKGPELREKLEKAAEKCKSIMGATADEVKDLLKDKPANTKRAKCLNACVVTEFNLVDATGQFDRSEFMSYTSLYFNNQEFIDISMKIFDRCYKKKKHIVSTKQCDDTEEFRVCMKTESEKIIKALKPTTA